MKILLIYYHPVTWDLAKTFIKLGHDVTVAINIAITDNYGKATETLQRAKKQYRDQFGVIPLALGIQQIKQKQYDLVGCDGVFDGDSLVMAACKDVGIPWFCIQGYPNVVDEPSQNILSLGCWLPIVQYQNAYPTEGHKKELDWKNIAETGRSTGKNVCIFYPNFWDIKDRPYSPKPDNGCLTLYSAIQKYEKYNKYSYQAFGRLLEMFKHKHGDLFHMQNIEGAAHEYFLDKLHHSNGLLHFKWADQPGIVIFEAMLMRRPVITLKSFILASANQEVLIDGYNAVVADSLEEIVDRVTPSYLEHLAMPARHHACMLTDFERQKHKLKTFLENCK